MFQRGVRDGVAMAVPTCNVQGPAEREPARIVRRSLLARAVGRFPDLLWARAHSYYMPPLRG